MLIAFFVFFFFLQFLLNPLMRHCTAIFILYDGLMTEHNTCRNT